ncbi:GNAT family N-acetyltransferase [Pseudomonas sp. Irchel s3a18]|uniref:GNAT family N-acetyltransferase n=1 Tax=Pseudomonas sp. Irchel s3a18 TaxID=2009053 RepID=UPI000BA4069E|nr:GNAT family N-acetyltransferase [Pseudomonas sp. Irchel s3a18]
MDCQVRLATGEDAEAISHVVMSALRESNARDYPADVIVQVEQGFSPQAIHRLMTQRRVYVASVDQRVVATASLEGETVRSVFVEPQHQGNGIGRQLMAVIHATALNLGLEVLHVPSSITAEGFYATLGFRKVRDEFHGAERTIIMQKVLRSRGS